MRGLLDRVGELAAAVIRPFVPEPGTTEGAVMLGLVFVASGFLWAEQLDSILYAPLALLVPGVTLVLLGSAPVIDKLLRRS